MYKYIDELEVYNTYILQVYVCVFMYMYISVFKHVCIVCVKVCIVYPYIVYVSVYI